MLDRLPPSLAELTARFLQLLPDDTALYLVGGAVRDLFLGRTVHDLDITMTGDVLGSSRHLADAVGAAYYPLDETRQTARIILQPHTDARQVVDIAAMRGQNLIADLQSRDFTINAIALDLRQPDQVVDPLNGLQDLHARRLRACSQSALMDDPVRIVRAVRLAFAYQLKIEPDTLAGIHAAVPLLTRVSAERQRDELFRILGSVTAAPAIRMLDHLGILAYLLPELVDLKGVAQSQPHQRDVWEHSLDTVSKLVSILDVLRLEYDPEGAGSLSLGLVSLRLGRYREQIHAHLSEHFTPDRSLRPILTLAALYHDVAKPRTQTVDENNRIRFFDHDRLGAEITAQRATGLRLSTEESNRLRSIIKYHMRPMLLAQDGSQPSKRAIYRFFRDAGKAGVDVCLLSLADFLATYSPALPQDLWRHHLDVIRVLLDAWWENPNPIVSPPALIRGRQLMKYFDLTPGPLVGSLLEAIREAQASGEVKTEAEALDLVEKKLKK